MVAPLHEPRRNAPTPAMREAYRLVACTLLPRAAPSEPQPTVAGWKAWLFAAWAVAATAAYIGYLVCVLVW